MGAGTRFHVVEHIPTIERYAQTGQGDARALLAQTPSDLELPANTDALPVSQQGVHVSGGESADKDP